MKRLVFFAALSLLAIGATIQPFNSNQTPTAAGKLVGRGSSSAGSLEDISPSSVLQMDGSNLGAVVRYLIPDARQEDWLLSNYLNLTNYTANRESRTMPSGFNLAKCFIFATNYLWAASYTSPAQLSRINPEDLTDSDEITFANDGKHNKASSIIYSPTKQKIYVTFESATSISVSEVDTATLAVTDVVDDTTYRSPVEGSTLATDNTYLYAIGRNLGDATNCVRKYALSDFSVAATVDLTNKFNSHAMGYDGSNLFLTGYNTSGASDPAWFIRMNTSDLSYTSLTLSTNELFPTQPMAFSGDYVFIPCEGYPFDVLRIHKTAFTVDHIPTAIPYGKYACWSDGTSIWAAGGDTGITGSLCKIDPVSLEVQSFALQSGENFANKVTGDGSRIYASCYQSPATFIRMTQPPIDQPKNEIFGSGGFSPRRNFVPFTVKLSNLSTSNDVYTVPIKYRAAFSLVGCSTTNGSSSTVFPVVVTNATYKRFNTTTTVTATAPAAMGMVRFVLEEGETLQVVPSLPGMNVWAFGYLFRTNEIIKTLRLYSLAASTNTLYVCPTNTIAYPPAMTDTVGAITATLFLNYANFSGGARTISAWLVPLGSTVSDANLFINARSVSDQNIVNIGIPRYLTEGDRVVIQTDATTDAQIAFMTVAEQKE